VDGDGDGKADPYNLTDAAFSCAHYLSLNGAPGNIKKAVYAYNHSSSYVNAVLKQANLYVSGEAVEVSITPTGGTGGTVVASDGMFKSVGKKDGPAQGYVWPKISTPYLKGPTNIHPILAERLVKLAKAKHQTITMTDGGRTYAQQVDIKRRKPNLAAKPGKSKHEAGLAVDVADGWLNAMSNAQLKPYGLHKTVLSKGETWHIEPVETGTANGRSNRNNDQVIAALGGLNPNGKK
jgi:hypothetical protein